MNYLSKTTTTKEKKLNQESKLVRPFVDPQYYHIGEVCKMLHIKPHNLRNWENRGLIKFEKDEQNDYRKIDLNALMDVHYLSTMRKLGVSYKDIIKLRTCSQEEAEKIFLRLKNDTEKRILTLQENCGFFAEHLDSIAEIKRLTALKYGLEKPFFDRALFFDVNTKSLNIWFDGGFAITIFEYKDKIRTPKGIKCTNCPKNYTPKPSEIAWKYDPSKIYISFLQKQKLIYRDNDSFDKAFDIDDLRETRKQVDSDILKLGFLPIRELSLCIEQYDDIVNFKCWMECEKLNPDATLPQR